MYRSKYPDVEEPVMVLVKRIDVMGVYVSLMEYGEVEGMILLSELSRRRIRSVKKLVRAVSLHMLAFFSFFFPGNPAFSWPQAKLPGLSCFRAWCTCVCTPSLTFIYT
jgi:hypothetical protein